MCFWLLVLFLLFLLVAALPNWPYSREWGYFPVGGAAALLILLLLLWWMALLPWWGAWPYWWGG